MKKNKCAQTQNNHGTKTATKAIYKRWQFWTLIGVGAIVIALILALTLDYHILSIAIRLACKPKTPSVPQNYDEILASTEASYGISYQSKYDNGYFDIYSPVDAQGVYPTLVYIHGGYYIGGGKASAEPYCRMIAKEGFTVVSMDYALAPEAKYPTQVIQVNEAMEFLVEHSKTYHVDSKRIFIGGDSAGGHLSAQMGLFYTDTDYASAWNMAPAIGADSLKGLLLLCGFYNTDTVGDCKFPMFDTAMWAFTGVRNYRKFAAIDEMNIVRNIKKTYPDSFVTCGGDDPFYTQAQELVTCMEENEIANVAYLPKSGKNKLKHEFQRDFSLEEGRIAMEQALDFMKDRAK